MKRILVVLLLITILFSGCVFSEKKTDESPVTIPNKEMIGVWINYNEISELVKNSDSQDDLYININSMLKEFSAFSINTIFLHCRAFDDSFYKSEIFPPSKYCIDSDGKLKYDVLDAFIKCAEKYNMSIHAWINPYRIRNDKNIQEIDKKTLAGEWCTDNTDQRLIVTENCIYYNPASVEVQKYILSGVKEILTNYSVCGIHIDDYFYPSVDVKIDNRIYADYLSNGGKLSLFDFRRENVNTLVSGIYSLVKSYNENIIFSVSPAADVYADCNTHYADVKLWASQNGYVDYLIPQIYFGFEHETMPFNDLLDEWKTLNNDNVKVVIGLGIYKSGKVDIYAKSGENEWIENSDIIKRQITEIKNNNLDGYVYFSSKYLLNNFNNVLENEKNNIIF